MTAPRAALVEVFASIQGEGRHAGVPMTFLRVATCPIRCLYCDTPESYAAPPAFPVGGGAGSRRERNPVTASRAAELVRAAGAGPAAPVSLTGGEPLVYPAFLRALGEELPGVPLHLETAALDPDALDRVLPVLAHVSADYKLPETLASGDFRRQHLRCLERAAAAEATVDVKVVLTPAVREDSVRRAMEDLLPLREAILLILQPATPFAAVTERPDPRRVIAWARAAQARGFDVRVLPQTHRLLDLP